MSNDELIEEWVDGWTDGSKERQRDMDTAGRTNGQKKGGKIGKDRCRGWRTGGLPDERTGGDRRIGGRMNGRINVQTDQWKC